MSSHSTKRERDREIRWFGRLRKRHAVMSHGIIVGKNSQTFWNLCMKTKNGRVSAITVSRNTLTYDHLVGFEASFGQPSKSSILPHHSQFPLSFLIHTNYQVKLTSKINKVQTQPTRTSPTF